MAARIVEDYLASLIKAASGLPDPAKRKGFLERELQEWQGREAKALAWAMNGSEGQFPFKPRIDAFDIAFIINRLCAEILRAEDESAKKAAA